MNRNLSSHREINKQMKTNKLMDNVIFWQNIIDLIKKVKHY